MELENKLAAYRAKKKREEQIQNLKEKAQKFYFWKKTAKIEEQQEPLLTEEDTKPLPVPEKPKQPEIPKPKKYWLLITYYTIILIVWALLWEFFIIQGFGTVYLIISALFGIYFNTRTGPKDENEVSAYSVFNKNCESIDGTLKAEQFENEIRFGAMSVH